MNILVRKKKLFKLDIAHVYNSKMDSAYYQERG